MGFETFLFVFSLFKIRTLKWDKNENQFFYFMKLLPEQGTVLDVGANIGIMSVLLGLNKPNLYVHSFEPIPENFKVLNRVCSLYELSNIKTHQLALGNVPGKLRMIMPIQGFARMQGLSHVINNENESGNFYEVESILLDSFFSSGDSKVVGIKLDVENFEYQVLKGSVTIIKRDRPIIYTELWENENRLHCIKLLEDNDYRPYLFNGKSLEVFTTQVGHNFFFIPNERVELLAS